MSTRKDKIVILLTIDALRVDHLSSYGYERETDYYLSKFIKKGYKFLNAYANGPSTASSFSSIFTSILPFLDGGYSPIPDSKIVFPQILRNYGISTIGIHSNPNLTKYYNYGKGFDIYLDGMKYQKKEEHRETLNLKQKLIYNFNKLFNFRKLIQQFLFKLKGFNKIKNILRNKIPFLTDVIMPITNATYNAPYITKKITSFMNKKEKPLFIWAHFMDIHSPYNPPTKNVLKFRNKDFNINERKFLGNEIFREKNKSKITDGVIKKLKILYDSEIDYVDGSLGKILNYIDRIFEKNCLIIITADHGECFFEHGYLGHQGGAFNELLKVPFIIIEKSENSYKHSIIKTPIQLIDIAPTILDYFNISIPEDFQGKSLIPILRGENKKFPKKRIIISEGYQKKGRTRRSHEDGFIVLSIIMGDWKYLFEEELNRELLFNLEEDPEENNNVADKNPQVLQDFRFIKQTHLKKVEESKEKINISKAIRSIKL
ncbi:MAG: hypothetical protein EU549_04455 [Promethearchaeota archaeon]|nr:MAG: hypothetical protein EU549_04455 [Candidatus Lokiarchaeota archaeon]